MKRPIPAELRGVLDALLLGLDPRLDQDERDACMLAAVADAPEFVAGVLTEIVTKHLTGLERLRALEPGTLVDRMRDDWLPETRQWPAGPIPLVVDETRTVATPGFRDGDLRRTAAGQLQEWGEGRWHDVSEPPPHQWTPDPGEEVFMPKSPFAVGGYIERQYAEAPPEKVWTVADAAEAAERARIARREAELAGDGPAGASGYPRHQTGGQPASGALRPPSGLDPRAADLIKGLQARRADEDAIDQADPDRPETMGPAMRAALDPTQLETDTGDVPVASPYGGNPADDYTACGELTKTGPCILRKGHLVLPVPGSDKGHLSQEASP